MKYVTIKSNPGRIYSITDKKLYSDMKEEDLQDILKIILEAKLFAEYTSDLQRLGNDDAINENIDKIKAAVSSVEYGNILLALEYLYNIYYASQSTDPLVREDIVELREQFGDAGVIDYLLTDISELSNKEVQLVGKRVHVLLSNARRNEAPQRGREHYKKFDEISWKREVL